MPKFLSIAWALLCVVPMALAQDTPAALPNLLHPPASLEFSIIKTSEATTLEAMSFSGGAFTKLVKLQHVAVLVRHPQGSFLFDTGLGKQIDTQFKEDMPLWAKPFFGYGPVHDARSQLDAAGHPPITRIFLSHGHWDHASGLVDFPEAKVWLSADEKEYLAVPHSVAVFPSQISPASIQWQTYAFNDKPYGAFPRSLDVFGDGSAVLVPLAGHTPGSVLLYLTLQSGKRFLLVGDAVWKADAIHQHRPKMWLASKIVDNDPTQTLDTVGTLARLQVASPDVVIVPAHDAAVHDTLGYFPHFTR